jgi:hypothetical protein
MDFYDIRDIQIPNGNKIAFEKYLETAIDISIIPYLCGACIYHNQNPFIESIVNFIGLNGYIIGKCDILEGIYYAEISSKIKNNHAAIDFDSFDKWYLTNCNKYDKFFSIK